MQSAKGESIPFPAPIRTRDARGCVEKWLIQVEENMKNAVRDIIDGALETIVTSSRCEWVQEWPCQAVLVAAFLDATAQSQEAIKGGFFFAHLFDHKAESGTTFSFGLEFIW